MATMAACSQGTSSLSLMPSFEGLRIQKGSVKVVPSSSSSSGSAYERLEVVANKRVQKRRQVVLTQDVTYLGKTGELLTVKPGYFRNYLLPYGKAKVATAELLKSIRLEEEKKEAEKRKIKEDAEGIARMFQTIGVFNVRRKGGQGKQIFGSVTTQDIVDIIKANTMKEIDKRIVTLPEIREVGQYIAEIKLHPEVLAQVKINVIGK